MFSMKEFSRFPTAVAFSLSVQLAACSQHEPPKNAMPQPVSVGYGTEDQAAIAGAVSSVNADHGSSAYTRIEDLIQARVAGVEVVRRGGNAISLRIRGASSLAMDAEPLIVVDGMPLSQFGSSSTLAAINPKDVQRIDVLKDAASAAIYGVRGANGVILITTKRW